MGNDFMDLAEREEHRLTKEEVLQVQSEAVSKAGILCFEEGVKIEACPFRIGSEFADLWRKGWLSAKNEGAKK